MSGVNNQVALDWIRSDLLESIENARTALDQYSESGEEMQLRACLTTLHQIHGTLVMLDLEGVTVLADHLEQLCQSLFDQKLSAAEQDSAAALLMQGILEMPGYLHEIQQQGDQHGNAAVPLTNDVRSLLGMQPIEHGGGASLLAKASTEAVDRFRQKVVRPAFQSFGQPLPFRLCGQKYEVAGAIPLERAKSLTELYPRHPGHEPVQEGETWAVRSLEDLPRLFAALDGHDVVVPLLQHALELGP